MIHIDEDELIDDFEMQTVSAKEVDTFANLKDKVIKEMDEIFNELSLGSDGRDIVEKYAIDIKHLSMVCDKPTYHINNNQMSCFDVFISNLLSNDDIPNTINLNWIDVSDIEDFSSIFYSIDFKGDISKWNTGNAKTFRGMFMNCEFNGDITNWDTTNVEDMSFMFCNNSVFNQDISKWDTSKVLNTSRMFYMANAFDKSYIMNWDLHRNRNKREMFGNV